MEFQESLWIILPFTPKVSFYVAVKYKPVLINLLMAASNFLAKLWKDDTVPSLREWRVEVHQICLISKFQNLSRFVRFFECYRKT